MSEFTINRKIDGHPICMDGNPLDKKEILGLLAGYDLANNLLAEERNDLQAQLSEAWAELATARAGWQETIAKMASQERPVYDEQQQRIAKLEAIKLGLTKTLVEMQSEYESLRKDAGRYRWLRDGNNVKGSEAIRIAMHHYGDEWDEMIDIAMGEESK